MPFGQRPGEYAPRYVKNFPQDWDDKKIDETFGGFGKIQNSVLLQDEKGRKFAFINYEDTEVQTTWHGSLLRLGICD